MVETRLSTQTGREQILDDCLTSSEAARLRLGPKYVPLFRGQQTANLRSAQVGMAARSALNRNSSQCSGGQHTNQKPYGDAVPVYHKPGPQMCGWPGTDTREVAVNPMSPVPKVTKKSHEHKLRTVEGDLAPNAADEQPAKSTKGALQHTPLPGTSRSRTHDMTSRMRGSGGNWHGHEHSRVRKRSHAGRSGSPKHGKRSHKRSSRCPAMGHKADTSSKRRNSSSRAQHKISSHLSCEGAVALEVDPRQCKDADRTGELYHDDDVVYVCTKHEGHHEVMDLISDDDSPHLHLPHCTWQPGINETAYTVATMPMVETVRHDGGSMRQEADVLAPQLQTFTQAEEVPERNLFPSAAKTNAHKLSRVHCRPHQEHAWKVHGPRIAEEDSSHPLKIKTSVATAGTSKEPLGKHAVQRQDYRKYDSSSTVGSAGAGPQGGRMSPGREARDRSAYKANFEQAARCPHRVDADCARRSPPPTRRYDQAAGSSERKKDCRRDHSSVQSASHRKRSPHARPVATETVERAGQQPDCKPGSDTIGRSSSRLDRIPHKGSAAGRRSPSATTRTPSPQAQPKRPRVKAQDAPMDCTDLRERRCARGADARCKSRAHGPAQGDDLRASVREHGGVCGSRREAQAADSQSNTGPAKADKQRSGKHSGFVRRQGQRCLDSDTRLGIFLPRRNSAALLPLQAALPRHNSHADSSTACDTDVGGFLARKDSVSEPSKLPARAEDVGRFVMRHQSTALSGVGRASVEKKFVALSGEDAPVKAEPAVPRTNAIKPSGQLCRVHKPDIPEAGAEAPAAVHSTAKNGGVGGVGMQYSEHELKDGLRKV